ncbi:MAG: GNAT family N-acetyltransferase [Candidatus Hadarchaeaceae archaeon]
MKIISYLELKNKNDLLPLMCLAFGWPFNYQEFGEIARIDPRLKDSPIGFCALEDDKVVGFAGVVNLTTKILEGRIENAGGVWGVAVLPSHARKGIFTGLMKTAHEYFSGKGYRFSFLTTSQSMIAHNFYRKLGYKDAIEFPSSYKFVEKKTSRKREKEIDLDKISKLYDDFTTDKTGIVVRDENYLKILYKREKIKPEMILLDKNGYAIFKNEGKLLRIKEIVATSTEEAKKLIRRLEHEAKHLVFDTMVLDEKMLKSYEFLKYNIHKKSYGLIMVKKLTHNVTFKEVYGENFYMTSLDWF